MSIPRPLPYVVLLASLLALGGCSGGVKQALGIERKPPDEFAVVSRPPLSLPPNYTLRPPRPGERRPQEMMVRDQARDVLLGQNGSGNGPAYAGQPAGGFGAPGQMTAGDMALLAHARTETADPEIRRLVDRESAGEAQDSRNFVERLMFWIDYPPPGDVVDARKEAQRLRENTALGRPVTEGETPTIERKARNRGITLF